MTTIETWSSVFGRRYFTPGTPPFATSVAKYLARHAQHRDNPQPRGSPAETESGWASFTNSGQFREEPLGAKVNSLWSKIAVRGYWGPFFPILNSFCNSEAVFVMRLTLPIDDIHFGREGVFFGEVLPILPKPHTRVRVSCSSWCLCCVILFFLLKNLHNASKLRSGVSRTLDRDGIRMHDLFLVQFNNSPHTQTPFSV